MELYVNGQKTGTLQFTNTGSWDQDWKTIESTARLGAGANYIELRTMSQSGPNLDELLIAD